MSRHVRRVLIILTGMMLGFTAANQWTGAVNDRWMLSCATGLLFSWYCAAFFADVREVPRG